MDAGVICCLLPSLKEEDLRWVVLNLNTLDCAVHVGMPAALRVCASVSSAGAGWVAVAGAVWAGG